MFARSKRLRRDEGGSSAVEFALVGPMMFMALFGVFAVGWAMHGISTMRLALEQSGRALQIDPSLNQAQLQAMVAKSMQSVGASSISVTLATQIEAGTNVAVLTGSYVFPIEIPMLSTYEIPVTTTVTVPLP